MLSRMVEFLDRSLDHFYANNLRRERGWPNNCTNKHLFFPSQKAIQQKHLSALLSARQYLSLVMQVLKHELAVFDFLVTRNRIKLSERSKIQIQHMFSTTSAYTIKVSLQLGICQAVLFFRIAQPWLHVLRTVSVSFLFLLDARRPAGPC